MAYTKFGEKMRILRIKNHEVMGDAAKALGVSTAFLSAVENGKKSIPKKWVNEISEHYQLNDNEKKSLIDAIDASKHSVKIDLSKASWHKREMAIQFQRSFDNLDEETAQEIVRLLISKGSD